MLTERADALLARTPRGGLPYANDPHSAWTHECGVCGYYVGIDQHGATAHMGQPKNPHKPEPRPLGAKEMI